ncbi:MAG TPA: hypothetical protein PLP88_14280, partial [Bacteroidales bacterium]|nr:hypothetical protein [Bacteroidales bacterium]
MKQIAGILTLLLILTACNKFDMGTMKYKAKFCTTVDQQLKTGNSDSTYTIFGDYITSITPYHFSSAVQMFVFQDDYNDQDPRCHMISFIENQQMDVDFSGNQEIEFNPVLHSTDIRNGLFEQKETDFRFISFVPERFVHEFEIPVDYLDAIKNLNSNDMLWGSTYIYDSINNKIKVNSTKHFSYGAIHGNANAKPTGFLLIFGETDSSHIYLYNGGTLPETERFPFWDSPNRVIIRSSNFQTQKIVMPEEGE